jgi:hypothetical protein
MIGSNFFSLVFLVALSLNSNFKCNKFKSMDIAEWFKDSVFFENQIKENYLDFKSETWSPIHPFKANFKAKSTLLYFCSIPILDSWLLKLDSCYTFYFIVKSDPNLRERISKIFGSHSEESTIEINYNSYPTAYHWDGEKKIILRKYYNILGDSKYDNCFQIIFGNMSFKSLIDLPGDD